ncbi:MAG: hypothetical protein ABI142_01765, partial [Bryocella sp.]
NWETKTEQDAKFIGKPGAFADIETKSDMEGSIIFTLYWPDENRWLGRNYEVQVHENKLPQTIAAVKPKS